MKKTTSAPRTLQPSSQLLQSSFPLLREHYVAVMYLFLLPGLVTALGSILAGDGNVLLHAASLSPQQLTGIAILLLGIIWQLLTAGPVTYFLLRTVDTKVDTLGDYYRHGWRYSWRVAIYYLAFALLVTAGLILFIVPGLIAIRRYALGGYYIVDNNVTVAEAFRLSAVDSKPFSGAIWGVIGLQVLIYLAAAVVQSTFNYVGIILGQFITCSYIFLLVLRYREIKPAAKA